MTTSNVVVLWMLLSGSFSDLPDLPDLLEMDVDEEAVEDFSELERPQVGRLDEDEDENRSRRKVLKVEDVGRTRE